MQSYIITILFAAVWFTMRVAYYPRRGSDFLYRAIARPALMAALIHPLLALGVVRGMDFFGEALFTYAAGGVACLGVAYILKGWPGDEAKNSESHIRGAKLISEKQLAQLTKDKPGHAYIGAVRIPLEVETFHFLLAGATGSGKTQAFLQLAGSARERGHTAVVADVGGEFAKRFYSPARGDVILNPADARSLDWSPLAEMCSEMDADRIARSWIPNIDGNGEAATWQLYAQTILSAILRRLFESGGGTNAEIVRLCTIASVSELADLVKGLPAQACFDEAVVKMIGSIRSIIASYITPLTWCNPDAGESAFSVGRHIKEGRPGWIFLTAREDQLDALRPLIAAQVDIAVSALLTLDPSDTRRVWFLLDEFASFGRIQGIEPLLTKGRKFGAVAVLGLQAISQVKDCYSTKKASTLLSNLSTRLTLRAQDAETADDMSRGIGDAEVSRWVLSNGQSDSGSSQNQNQQITLSRAVLPSELYELRNLRGMMKLLGEYPVGVVDIPVSNLKATQPAFVGRQRRADSVAA